MKNWIAVLAVYISTSTQLSCPSGQYWVVGCLDSISQFEVQASTETASGVVLRSDASSDCYTLHATPNGTLYTKWVPCPK